MQDCFKCDGRGFCHDSSMQHDKDPDERCFFCSACIGCGGRGAIPARQTIVQQGVAPMGPMGMPAAAVVVQESGGLRPCCKCDGQGFCHTSSMNHDAPLEEKCFFCEECNTCGGKGAIPAGQMTEVISETHGYGLAGGMVTVQESGVQPCFKCDGKGFCHTSSMDHDKDEHERCLFCSNCAACGGCGAIDGGVTTIQAGIGGIMGGTVVAVHRSGPRACFKCDGKGFCHDSSMNHDKEENERCFFCSDCNGCGGCGAITE